jgi:hypothetical protein
VASVCPIPPVDHACASVCTAATLRNLLLATPEKALFSSLKRSQRDPKKIAEISFPRITPFEFMRLRTLQSIPRET